MRRTIPLLVALIGVPVALHAADVTSLTLINADTDQPISGFDPLPAGAALDLSALPTANLNLRANVSASVGSVKFTWSGAESGSATESTAPYAMKGDSSGDYNAWTPTAGSYSVTATPYTQSGAGGSVAGAALTLAFSVATGSTPPPPPPGGNDGDGSVAISGELKRWHKVTLTLDGPYASESGTANPFLDHRMDVTFSNGSLSYVVPGYFAADGNAGETSATAGTKWRAHLSPDLTGTWTYTVSFRSGTDVAVNGGGTTRAPYHGKTGTFTVAETDKSGRDFRGKGRLQYVGARYLRHKGNGEWFVKVGADSPENLLGYADFDGTYDHGGGTLKTWTPHVGDWKSGDPTWQGGKGKGLIGAVNYLAAEGQNVFSFLTYNAGGDGKDVWPFTAHDARTRYDCSKLDQWEILFAHADRLGMYLHFKTQETENDNGTWGLDGGAVGRERTLYYRELIARFGHHLALNWNLGEENTQTDAERKAMAQFFWDNDPYRHHVVLHTYPGEQESVYRPLLGSASKLTGVSIQIGATSVHQETLQWINESTAAGKVWVVANDEQGSANTGIPSDAQGNDSQRKTVLWGNLMAGGAGIESYFGYGTGETDLTAQDFRSRDRWWDYCRFARTFVVTHLPFTGMVNANALIGNSTNSNAEYCFAKVGEVYAVYLPSGGTTDLDLSGVSGTFEVRWYDPRNGGTLQTGTVASISGGGQRSLGNAPSSTTADWAVLVRRTGGTTPVNVAPSVSAGPDRAVTLPGAASLDGTVTDDGLPSATVTVTWTKVSGPGTVTFANAAAVDTTATFSAAGSYVLRLTASDGALSATDDVAVTVASEPTSSLPAPWATQDIGAVAAAGSASASGGVFTVAGSGADIWGSSDEFRFVHQPVSGDVTLTARVDSLTNTNAWAKAGLMVRESLSANARHAFICVTPGSGVSFQRRTATGGTSAHTTQSGLQAPQWLKLVRSGGTFTGYRSPDGVTWTQVGSVSIAMAADVHVGLAVTSHADGVLATAVLSSLSVGGGTAPVNQAPTVSAGPDLAITLPAGATLDGTVGDDGLPSGTLTTSWTMVSGPGAVSFADATAVDTTATFTVAGTYVLRLGAGDSALSASDEVTVTVAAAPSAGTVLAVNAGGPAYTAVDGTAYVADTGFTGGKTYAASSTLAIAGTGDDALFRTERYGTCSWRLPAADGDHLLTLQFAEVYWSANGKRVFDVEVEGVLRIDDLDIHAVAGRAAAYEVDLPVTIADGALDLRLITVVDNAKLSGFVLVPMPVAVQ